MALPDHIPSSNPRYYQFYACVTVWIYSVGEGFAFTYAVLTTVALTDNVGGQFFWTWDQLKGISLVGSARVFPRRDD